MLAGGMARGRAFIFLLAGWRVAARRLSRTRVTADETVM